jgi:hypothetical protein
MGWAQVTWIVLIGIGIGLECAKHGEPKTGRHNGWTQVIAAGLVAGLLYAGGFFDGGGA